MYQQSKNQTKKWIEEPFDNLRFPMLKSSIEKNPKLHIDFLIGSGDPWLNCAMPFAFYVYGPFSGRVKVLYYLNCNHDNVCVPAFRRVHSRLQFWIQSINPRDSGKSKAKNVLKEPITLDSSPNDGEI